MINPFTTAEAERVRDNTYSLMHIARAEATLPVRSVAS